MIAEAARMQAFHALSREEQARAIRDLAASDIRSDRNDYDA